MGRIKIGEEFYVKLTKMDHGDRMKIDTSGDRGAVVEDKVFILVEDKATPGKRENVGPIKVPPRGHHVLVKLEVSHR